MRRYICLKYKEIQSSSKTIRMPDPLIEKLQSLADKNDISFNNLVVQCCEYRDADFSIRFKCD